jgi:site-specific DNA recombinase
MKLALYARVSSDGQREAQTVSSQLEALHEFAFEQNWQVEKQHVYVDDGHSGYHFDRPALDRLRDGARDGLLDLLLVHDPDRLARRYAYQVLLLEELERFGVEVRFLKQPPPDSPDQKLLVQIQGAISEYERARIMERTRRGRLFWARQGRPVSAQVPYGYRYVRRDSKEDPSIVVDEAEAQVVRQIIGWYAEDQLSYHQIALRLTTQGTPTPRQRSKYWDNSTVRIIVRNETYLGTWNQNRYRTEPVPDRARPRIVERPREEWIPIPVPPIVDSHVFSRAREIRERGRFPDRLGPKPLRYPETHLLRRLVVCGPCGRKMTCHNSSTGRGYLYYWCRGPDPHRINREADRCPNPTTLAPQLDEFVWSDVVALLTDPDLLLQAWREQQGSKAARQNSGPLEQEVKRLKKQIADWNKQRQRLLVAYQESAITLEELVQRRNQLEEKIIHARQHLEGIETEQQQQAQLTDLNQNIRSMCEALEKGLDNMNKKERMVLCQQLIERVVVTGTSAEIHYRFPVSTDCNRSGKRHQLVFSAPFTAEAAESMGQDTAFQECPELPFHETGPVGAGLASLHPGQKGIEVLLQHLVQHRGFRLSPSVDRKRLSGYCRTLHGSRPFYPRVQHGYAKSRRSRKVGQIVRGLQK